MAHIRLLVGLLSGLVGVNALSRSYLSEASYERRRLIEASWYSKHYHDGFLILLHWRSKPLIDFIFVYLYLHHTYDNLASPNIPDRIALATMHRLALSVTE